MSKHDDDFGGFFAVASTYVADMRERMRAKRRNSEGQVPATSRPGDDWLLLKVVGAAVVVLGVAILLIFLVMSAFR